MAKYTIQAKGVIKTLSTNKIRQFMLDNPKAEIGVQPLSNMPVSLHNAIAEHNKKLTSNR